ncbi:uncharacterized protein LOC128885817 isoform X3 [Hylaeus anthracinus]|uniref:uncharacterized protein LOC128885817 isoform X3 n=1 Tax=Hylaeus anthracinus TaxID=313031 RepID=UPI0023B8ACAE|nr:uncharacterized protein LOC128885817 isoform X3 [Hylaeus anthracinus]
MDNRLDTSGPGYSENVSSYSKKSKKRSSKRSSMFGPWINSTQNNQNNDVVPGMEYQHVLWHANVQQNFSNNGQRLFATTSDPSMRGYGQLPMTYAMEPVSLPTMYRLYQPVPFSGIRPVHGRPRRQYNQCQALNVDTNSMANGYTSLQENGLESPIPVSYENGDYASLPPTANKSNGINGDELNAEHRRYSDPGVGSAEGPVHAQSEDSESIGSGSSITTIGRSNKLVLSLIEQMTDLKKSNSQLFKELNETKSELGSMKAKLAQCTYSTCSDYQPGMLSDLIREIRQANKTCEEGLVANVKSMMEEKLNQMSLDMANLNKQVTKLTEEKAENERRVAKLQDEVAILKLNANNEGREIAAFEEETLALRRELQEARASKTLAENHVANWTVDDTHGPVSSTRSVAIVINDTDRDDGTREETSGITFAEIPRTLENETPDSEQEDEPRDLEERLADQICRQPKVEEAKVGDDELDCTRCNAEADETITNRVPEKGVKGSRNESNKKEDETTATVVRGQKGGSKKSRKKKGNATSVKRSLGERAKSASEVANGTTPRDGSTAGTVSEDEEDRLDDDLASRAITEIPEVAVVGGGSFVPKDLCSTGILTSRVLTAPSRATYTTAYI